MTTPDAMTCAEAAAIVHAYLDREVDEVTQARLEHHLEICRECGMELELYRQIKEAIAARRMPLPPDAVQRMQDYARGLLDRFDGDGDGDGNRGTA